MKDILNIGNSRCKSVYTQLNIDSGLLEDKKVIEIVNEHGYKIVYYVRYSMRILTGMYVEVI